MLVFLGSFNRIETLQRTVASYRGLIDPYEIVIVDNGSDHPRSLEVLDELERLPEVRKVYRLGKIDSMTELTANYNIALRDQYRLKRRRDRWFAVTDADICFDGSHPRSLSTYVSLARGIRKAAGPHTRVDNSIPTGYPLRHRVLACESPLLYRDTMQWYGDIPYSNWAIDTTFHVFPAAPEHRRLKLDTVRVGPPYDAMHLDWYVDVFNPNEENWAYIPGVGSVGSWGKSWIADFWLMFQGDRDYAFRFMKTALRNQHDDLCITSFVLSWCYRELAHDDEMSKKWLRAAIPKRFPNYWTHEDDWYKMIYDADFSCLGWDDVED